MNFLFLLFLSLFLSGNLFSKDTEYLERIPSFLDDQIYDPNQWLTNDARSEIIDNLKKAKSDWNVEIYTVILSDAPEGDPELFAKKAAQIWGEAKLWGVVLHVIGDPNAPLFFVGRKESFGWSDQQEGDFSKSLLRVIEIVEGRAMREQGKRLQVQTGVRELCDELGYLGLVKSRIEKRYDTIRGDHLTIVKRKHTKKKFIEKILIVTIPFTILLIGIFIYLFKKKVSATRSSYFFPETSPRVRLMAPWSGGANVIVSVGSRLDSDGSRKG